MNRVDDILKLSGELSDGERPLVDVCRGSFDFLRRFQRADGEISEFPRVSRLPEGQYATSFFALSAVLLYLRSGEDNILKYLRPAVDASLKNSAAGPEISDNNFALLMIYLALASVEELSPPAAAIRAAIREAIPLMSYKTGMETTEGNNNYVLRVVCEYMSAGIAGNAAREREAVGEFERCVSMWQMDDGVFFDYPRRVSADGEFLAPSAYHARFAALTMIFAALSGDSFALDSGRRAVSALGKLVAPGGDIGYYGRSSGTIFAQVNAFLAFRLAQRLFPADSENYAPDIAASVVRDFSENGRFKIIRAHAEKSRRGYENYMYNSVYCAYAAAMFLLGCSVFPRAVSASPPEKASAKFSCEYLKDSGFLVFRSPELSFESNMKGAFFYDDANGVGSGAKYPLFSFLSVRSASGDCLPGVPAAERNFFSAVSDELDPALAGFEPFFAVARSKKIVPGRPSRLSVVPVGSSGNVVVEASGKLLAVDISRPDLIWRLAAAAFRRARSILGRNGEKPLRSAPRKIFSPVPDSSYLRRMNISTDGVVVSYDIKFPLAPRGFLGVRTFPETICRGDVLVSRSSSCGVIMVFDGIGDFAAQKRFYTASGPADFRMAPIVARGRDTSVLSFRYALTVFTDTSPGNLKIKEENLRKLMAEI